MKFYISLFAALAAVSCSPVRAQPAPVLADPVTGVLVRPSAALFKSANAIGTGDGGGIEYTFTAADFNLSGVTVSLDYTNAQKATSTLPGFLSAADWVTFNAKQAGSANLTAFAAIAPSVNIQTLLGAASYAAARALLDLEAGIDFLAYPTGTATGAKFLRDDNSWQSIPGGGDLLASNNLSDLASASTARTNLGLAIGTNVQAYSAALAGTTASFTTAQETKLSGIATGATANASDANLRDRTTHTGAQAISTVTGLQTALDGLQPLDSDLTSIAAITTTSFGRGLLAETNASTLQGTLNLTPGTNVQAYDADLSAIAALDGTNTLYYRSASNTWTPVTIGSNITFSGGTLSATGGSGSGDVVASSFANGAILYVSDATAKTVAPITGFTYDSVTGEITYTGTLNATTVNAAGLTGVIPQANGGTGVANSHTITTTANATIGGTNTGDQTSVTGNAGTATALATARTINGVSFDGTANITVPSDIAPGTSGNVLTSNGTVWTSAAPTGGGSAETGDVKFILDSATVSAGWGLTGVNGIPAFTTPDADYKAVIKMAGTVATPTASPAAGEVADGSTITFSSSTPGVTFIRKTDGADPARGDGTTGGTATLSGATTYKVRAYIDGQYLADSAVATFAYTLPASGPTLTFYWGMEAGTWSNASYAAGSATGTLSGTPTLETTTVKVGANAMFASNNQYVTFVATSNIDHLEGAIGMWFRAGALDNFRGLFNIQIDTSNRIQLHTYNTGKLRYQYTSGGTGVTLDTAGTAMATNTWYFIVARWDKANSDFSIEMYDTSGSLVDSAATTSGSTGTWSGTPTVLKIGEWVASGSSNLRYDNVMISADDQADLVASRDITSYP